MLKKYDRKNTKLIFTDTDNVLNRPIYVGMAILDLSKLLMYDFHYNYMLKKYDRKNTKLIFTDTDNVFYEIKTDDVYEDLLKDKELFDNSDYPKKSAFFFFFFFF